MYKSSLGFKNSGSGQVPSGDNHTNASSTYFNAYGSNAKQVTLVKSVYGGGLLKDKAQSLRHTARS